MPAKIMYMVHPHGTPTLYTEVGPSFSVAGYKISKGVVGKLFGRNQKQNLQTKIQSIIYSETRNVLLLNNLLW
jgi:hypothetical protein